MLALHLPANIGTSLSHRKVPPAVHEMYEFMAAIQWPKAR